MIRTVYRVIGKIRRIVQAVEYRGDIIFIHDAKDILQPRYIDCIAIDSFPRRQDVGYRWHHKYAKIGVESWLTITSHGKPS